MNVCTNVMDECMYECNGWMYGLMDGWTHLCIYVYMFVSIICVSMYRRIYAFVNLNKY